MKKIATPILLTAFLCSCMQSADVPPVSQSTIMQLTGTWLTENKHGNIRFYNDETAKLTLPKHNPPIKLISPYEAVKENTIGIALGGF